MSTSRTRTVILLVDGAADYPVERLGGRTPLMAAQTPNMDALAQAGCGGTLATVPSSMTPDSAVANLSVLGYDPLTTYQGRGVLEAASLGVPLGPQDLALRANLVAFDGERRMLDHSAGHIGNDEAHELVAMLAAELGQLGVELHPGTSYRHLLVLRNAAGAYSPAVRCFPPHDHVGVPVASMQIQAAPATTEEAAAAERTAALLRDLTAASQPLLARHSVNLARRAAGQRQASSLWFWAAGRRPSMATLQDRFGVRGAVISAVDLIHGLGRYAGMTSIPVQGATGLYDTNYEGKAAGALAALEDHDIVYVHVEGADEAGHARDLETKVACIEAVDRRLLAPLLAGAKSRGWELVIGVLPDHLTPVERGDHVGEPVPVVICDPARSPDGVRSFDEVAVTEGSLGALQGADFIETLLRRR